MVLLARSFGQVAMPKNLYIRDSNRRIEYTPLEERFIREMIVDPVAPSVAAERAGYAPLAAAAVADNLMGKAHIVHAVNDGRRKLRDELAKQTGMELADIVRAIAEIATFDPADLYDDNGNVRPLDEMPRAARMALEGIDSEEVHEGRGRDREHVADIRKLKFTKRSVWFDMLMRHHGGYELDNRQKTDPVTELIREINGRRSSLPIVE